MRSSRSTVWLVSVLLVCGLSGCGGSSSPQRAAITVSPAIALWDQARTIVVSHLHSGQLITLQARSVRPDGTWTSSATFRADHAGVVDVARQAPVSGSYSGVSGMGLLWSETRRTSRAGPENGSVTTTLTVTATNATPTSAEMTQQLEGAGITLHTESLRSRGFFGVYAAPPSTVSRAPAVVLWGGSEGGIAATLSEATLLASHGIPALAVAYFDEPGLPCRLQNIPLEYFVRAITWLHSQRQVDPRRVWLWSASRGTEAELLVAAHFPRLIHGLVAEAPSSYVHGAYPGTCTTTGTIGRAPAWTLHAKPVRQGLTPVRRIEANVLLIAGGQDMVWPSYSFAPQIMAELPHDGAARRYLYYPKAGHTVLGIPYSPVTREETGDGGTAASDSAAHISDWPAAIRFTIGH